MAVLFIFLQLLEHWDASYKKKCFTFKVHLLIVSLGGKNKICHFKTLLVVTL